MAPSKAQRFKTFTFSELVGDVDGELKMPLAVALPAVYERAQLPEASAGDSYWMPRPKMRAAAESGKLPADTGYFHTNVSLDVRYDETKKQFVGFEDQDIAAEMKKSGIEQFTWERADLQGYPVIFCRFQNPSKKEFQYGAYIAPLADGLVFYVSYAPPLGKPAEGEEAWRRFRSALAGKP